jgi:putative redox protein
MIRATRLPVPFQCSFSNGTHHGVADVPVDRGGNGLGFGPHDLLEAALATCMTITLEKVAQSHHYPLTSAACEVQIDRSVPGSVTLRYHIHLDGPLSQEQSDHLHRVARDCPVARTLSGCIYIEPTLNMEETS